VKGPIPRPATGARAGEPGRFAIPGTKALNGDDFSFGLTGRRGTGCPSSPSPRGPRHPAARPPRRRCLFRFPHTASSFP